MMSGLMDLISIPLIIVVLYLVILYGLTWYSTKLNKGGMSGFLLAGRGFPTSIVAVMVPGMAVGGAATVGVAQNAFMHGMAAAWFTAAWALGALLVGLVVAEKYRNLECATVPELFERYFDVPGRLIAVLGQIIIQMTITALQFVAGGAILAALLPEIFTMQSGMLFSAFVFVGIALVGGYWAAGLTNLVNVVIIYFGIIFATILAVVGIGGMSALAVQLPTPDHAGWFTPFGGLGMAFIIAWFLVMTTQAFSTQGVVQIAFAAKDGKTARRGFIISSILILPAGIFCAILGLVAVVKFPDILPAMALPMVVMELNPYAAGLALAALWAADLSTAVGLLLGSSALVVNDIWKRFVRQDISQREQLIVSRVTIVLISIVTYLLATNVLGIIQTLMIGLTLTTSYTIVLLFSLFAPQYCKRGSAFWTILVGIIYLAFWQLYPHGIPLHPIYLAWPVGLITFFIVYFVDKRPSKIPMSSK